MESESGLSGASSAPSHPVLQVRDGSRRFQQKWRRMELNEARVERRKKKEADGRNEDGREEMSKEKRMERKKMIKKKKKTKKKKKREEEEA